MFNAIATIVFLSREFLADDKCVFQATLSAVRYAKTTGFLRHRVVLVILEPCKIPIYLSSFKAIAWRGFQDLNDQLWQIYAAVDCGKKANFYITAFPDLNIVQIHFDAHTFFLI